jgi:hypothetical protein
MAIICTNYLTGNDTTGDGSVATPYKTIIKALSLASSNDEIRVAGGQWIPITGTLTFTNGTATVNTTTDLRSVLSVKDVLTFDDGEFGFDKFHVAITAITASTLTLQTFWTGPTITTSSLYKLDTYSYDFTTSNTGIESFNTAACLPNGRTGISISGGWNSAYTSNANGWTVYRSTATGGLFTAAASPGIGDWKQNLVLDKFLLYSTVQSNFFQSFAGTTGPSGPACAIRNLAFTGVARFTVSGTLTSIFGFWNPTGEESNFYLTGNSTLNAQYLNSATYAQLNGAGATIPEKTDVNVWISGSDSNTTVPNSNPTSSNYLPAVFPSATVFRMKDVYFRTCALGNQPGNVAYINNISTNTVYLENLNLYCNNNPMVFDLSNGATSSRFTMQLFNVGFTGAYASNSGLTYGDNLSQTLIEFPNYTVESTNPCYGSNNGATAGSVEPNTTLSRLSQSYLSAVQVKDSEGLKTMDVLNNIYYKDNVNNWLKVTAAKISGATGQTGGFKSWSMLGVLERPSTAFTVSVTLKVDGGTWDQIGIQYGPQTSQLITQSISPTTSFATYTVTVDPADYSNWNAFIFPLYIGIRSTMPNLYYNEPSVYCYVNSLTIV